MKVLHIINNLSSGGAESMLRHIAVIQKQKGVDVEILIFSSKNCVFKDILINNNIKIHSLNATFVYNPFIIFKLIKYLKCDFDIFHVHLFPPQYWVAIASLFIRKKINIIFTEHSTHNRRRDIPFLYFLERFIYKKYSKIVCISEGVFANLNGWIGLKEKQIVIRNGILLEKFSKAIPYSKNELGFRDDDILVIMVGRFTEAKDHKTVVDTFKLLDKNVHLLLVGEGVLKNDTVKYVDHCQLNNKIHFLGFRNDIERLYKTCDFGILSSNWEGFGLVAVECMVCCKPIICTNINGLNEVMPFKELQFEIGNIDELSTIINKLINNKDFYEKYSLKSFKQSELFDIENTVNEYNRLYSSLINF